MLLAKQQKLLFIKQVRVRSSMWAVVIVVVVHKPHMHTQNTQLTPSLTVLLMNIGIRGVACSSP